MQPATQITMSKIGADGKQEIKRNGRAHAGRAVLEPRGQRPAGDFREPHRCTFRVCRLACAHYVQEAIGVQYPTVVGRFLQSLAARRFYSSGGLAYNDARTERRENLEKNMLAGIEREARSHAGRGTRRPGPIGGGDPRGREVEAQRATAGRITAVRLLVAGAIGFLLYVGHVAFIPVALALLLSLVLSGPVESLHRVGLPRGLGAALVMLVIVGLAGGLTEFLAEPAQHWFAEAPHTVKVIARKVDRWRNS